MSWPQYTGSSSVCQVVFVIPLLKEGAKVGWAKKSFTSSGRRYPAGAIIVSGAGTGSKIQSLAKEFNLQIQAGSSTGELMQLKVSEAGSLQALGCQYGRGLDALDI